MITYSKNVDDKPLLLEGFVCCIVAFVTPIIYSGYRHPDAMAALKGKPLIYFGIALIFLVLGIAFILTRIGSAYKTNLDRFTEQRNPSSVTHMEKEQIRKITLQRNGDPGCMEVSPDGVVRLYSVCGTELSDARRITDPKYILALYKKVAESAFVFITQEESAACQGYIMTVQTDSGLRLVCLNNSSSGQSGGSSGGSGGSGGGGIDDIIETIEKIIEDIPPTPTPTGYMTNPTPTIDIYTSPTPTTEIVPPWEMTPTPPMIILQPFTCDFTDLLGKKKPFNVSNIICSSQPTPAP